MGVFGFGKGGGELHGDVNGGQDGVRSEVEDGNERDEVENTEKSSSQMRL